MRKAIATVVRVSGHCSAGYKSGDKIIVNLNNACIDKEQSYNLCIFALNAILANMARIRRWLHVLTLQQGLVGMLFLEL